MDAARARLILGVERPNNKQNPHRKKTSRCRVGANLEAVLGIDPAQLLQLQKSYELAKAQLELRLDPVCPLAQLFLANCPSPTW